ncbi:hypothetical protein DSO57_1029156 [Entomophthora muscae]|uniref:Uncharacterized protein n=1 Tax=Entomophthora muscae TaxID=34485 RepID=A0ACC2UM33_9FUNG|nr:hypothetical protein DSO57_1029156 [Entomophthora muscae]
MQMQEPGGSKKMLPTTILYKLATQTLIPKTSKAKKHNMDEPGKPHITEMAISTTSPHAKVMHEPKKLFMKVTMIVT